MVYLPGRYFRKLEEFIGEDKHSDGIIERKKNYRRKKFRILRRIEIFIRFIHYFERERERSKKRDLFFEKRLAPSSPSSRVIFLCIEFFRTGHLSFFFLNEYIAYISVTVAYISGTVCFFYLVNRNTKA